MYTYQERVTERRQARPSSRNSTKVAKGIGKEYLEYPMIFPSSALHDSVNAERHSSRSAGPSPMKHIPAHDTPPATLAELGGIPVGPRCLSRPSLGQPDDGNIKGAMDSTIAVSSRKGEDWRMQGAMPAPRRADIDSQSARPPMGISAPPRAERVRRIYPSSQHTFQGASNLTVQAKMPHGAPDTPANLTQGPPRTHFFVSQPDGSGGAVNAYQPSRSIGVPMPFSKHEGDIPVRPLVLSETRVLADKDVSEQAGDAQSELTNTVEPGFDYRHSMTASSSTAGSTHDQHQHDDVGACLIVESQRTKTAAFQSLHNRPEIGPCSSVPVACM